MESVRRLNLCCFPLTQQQLELLPTICKEYLGSVIKHVDKLKEEGNKAFNAGRYSDAIREYSLALLLDPYNAVLYSNRSLCLQKLGINDACKKDAICAHYLKPDWAKPLVRLGELLLSTNDFALAATVLDKAILLEPTNRMILELRQLVKEKLKQNPQMGNKSQDVLGMEIIRYSLIESLAYRAVTIKSTSNMGRGLFVAPRRSFSAGVPAFIDYPLLTYTARGDIHACEAKLCLECMNSLENITQLFTCPDCSGCFCSKECYSFAMLKTHQVICPIRKTLEQFMPYAYMVCLALAHIVQDYVFKRPAGLWFHLQDLNHDNVDVYALLFLTFSSDVLYLHTLLSTHFEQIYDQLDSSLEVLKKSPFFELHPDARDLVSISTAKEIVELLQRNGFARHSPHKDTSQLGGVIVDLYPVASYINHSCSPNAKFERLHNGAIVITPTVTLNEGDQIFIDYLQGLKSTQRDAGRADAFRRETLRMMFGFDCRCHLCLT